MLLNEGPKVLVTYERENPFGDLESLTPVLQMPGIQPLDSNV